MAAMKEDRIKNKEKIRSIKKNVRCIATGSPVDSGNLNYNTEDDLDSSTCDDNETDSRINPSLLEMIRSSEAVQSISFFKRMNPFIKWNESKYISRVQMRREGIDDEGHSYTAKNRESSYFNVTYY